MSISTAESTIPAPVVEIEDVRPDHPGVVVFDIETGPLPEDELRKIFEPTKPEDVPLGNRSKPDVVAAYIEQYLAEEWDKFVAGAALSPLTGRVVTIGMCSAAESFEYFGEHYSEAQVLAGFWISIFEDAEQNGDSLVGFNIFNFDLPFLINRSRILGVEVPATVVNGRYFSRTFVDLHDLWTIGRPGQYVSLNKLCRAMGLGEKNGDGADFAHLWETDRETAIAYLRNDLAMTTRLANRLRIGAPVT